MDKNWRIYNIIRTLPEGLVIKVTYGCEIKSTNFQDRKVGTIEITGDVNSPDFIPFENLTEELVVTWVKDALGDDAVLAIENALETRLTIKENALTNKGTQEGLPWV